MLKGNVQVDSNNQTQDTQTVATCCVYLVLGGRKGWLVATDYRSMARDNIQVAVATQQH